MCFLDSDGFDWNGDGKSDAFDTYMDMKVSGRDSSDSNGDESETNSTHKKYSNPNENKELKGISIGGKPLYDATKDRNGVTILKCLLVTALCVGGIALPVMAEMGTLGTLLSIFGGIGLSLLVFKNI